MPVNKFGHHATKRLHFDDGDEYEFVNKRFLMQKLSEFTTTVNNNTAAIRENFKEIKSDIAIIYKQLNHKVETAKDSKTTPRLPATDNSQLEALDTSPNKLGTKQG